MGARFEALDEGVLAAASKSTGYFFAISISQKVRWVVRDTFLAELKTLFGLVVAGFEPGFSDPKARALPLRQSYAVKEVC